MKRDCLCGHMWYVHANYGQCAHPGCGCSLYRPRPRRRWFGPKTPAAEEKGSSPVPRGGETTPPRSPPPPLPGHQPRRILDIRVAKWDCNCHTIRDYLTGGEHTRLCPRHEFAAHWNQRLEQS